MFDRFAKLVADGAGRIKVGWSQSFDLDMGSMIHPAHAAKVQERIDAAVRAGASVLTGARRRSDLGDAFVEPTVFDPVRQQRPDSGGRNVRSCCFTSSVSNREEAITLANDSPYGLKPPCGPVGAGPRWLSRGTSNRALLRINSSLMIYNAFDLPMGGIKQSGIGRRHGERGILRYTQEQSIARSFAMGGGYDRIADECAQESAASTMLKFVRLWRRIPGLR